MSYVTLDEFKAAITIADTVDDSNLQRALDAATEWIDHYCGRTFHAADTSLNAKRFTAKEVDRLSVPDVQSVSLLEVDTDGDGTFAQIVDIADFELLPLEPDLGGYTEIHLLPNAPWLFVVGNQVRVTGIWGYGSTPPSVQQACILAANRWFHRPSAPFGMWESPTTGNLSDLVDRDIDVTTLLEPFVTAGGAGRGSSAAWVMV